MGSEPNSRRSRKHTTIFPCGPALIVLGVIDEGKWGCGFLCHYPVVVYAETFDLSEAQVQQIAANPAQAPVVLSETQRAKIAAFEANLELGREAIEVHVMSQPIWGEVLPLSAAPHATYPGRTITGHPYRARGYRLSTAASALTRSEFCDDFSTRRDIAFKVHLRPEYRTSAAPWQLKLGRDCFRFHID